MQIPISIEPSDDDDRSWQEYANCLGVDPDRSLQHFIEQMTKLNGGRAFFTTPQTLGDYVLVDFIEQKREMLRARR